MRLAGAAFGASGALSQTRAEASVLREALLLAATPRPATPHRRHLIHRPECSEASFSRGYRLSVSRQSPQSLEQRPGHLKRHCRVGVSVRWTTRLGFALGLV